ncbi:MAG TPA: DCC1-like thiol-disulfide oxidoreductase family protein [Solirubrobacterales bacterium]|nr:DCC1-like thiol-disulfide oxidoreductase family protein [Solirubrobacterales bacterium]
MTLIYDSDCGFCRWLLAKLLAWDRRGALRPVALETEEADRLLAGMPKDRRMASWHLVDAAGGVSSAGAAFAPLFRLLPGGSPLAAPAERAPRLTEGGYRWVADRRSVFGRLLTDGAKARADRRIEERRRARVG